MSGFELERRWCRNMRAILRVVRLRWSSEFRWLDVKLSEQGESDLGWGWRRCEGQPEGLGTKWERRPKLRQRWTADGKVGGWRVDKWWRERG